MLSYSSIYSVMLVFIRSVGLFLEIWTHFSIWNWWNNNSSIQMLLSELDTVVDSQVIHGPPSQSLNQNMTLKPTLKPTCKRVYLFCCVDWLLVYLAATRWFDEAVAIDPSTSTTLPFPPPPPPPPPSSSLHQNFSNFLLKMQQCLTMPARKTLFENSWELC